MDNTATQNNHQYEEIGAQIGRLLEKKQWAYGNAFDHTDEVMKVLFPGEIKREKYPTLLAVTRIVDKLFRITSGKDDKNEDPWMDIAGYAILMMVALRSRKN